MELHPQLQAIFDRTAAAGGTGIGVLSAIDLRAQAARGREALPPGPELFDVRDVEIPSAAGPIRARIYHPNPGPSIATVVYFHSGGWVVGSVDGSDALVRTLAEQSGCTYLSVEYRLAPEHTYPCALDDARAAVEWAQHLAGPLILHGDSAGGNLAALLAIEVGARRDTKQIALQVLGYPVTDHDFARSSYLQFAEGGLLSGADMRWFWDQYVPDESLRDMASPLRSADLADTAPALVVVADHDPLRDDGLAYADALARAGVPVSLLRYADACHGFLGLCGVVDRGTEGAAEIARAICAAVR